ncbi:MAG TPA: DUF3048 domain-containing protein [Patescibacteria group bacterium]|nr:DUF3048 domain-containing protein [Patescibacteria group bacterium]
MIDGFRSRRRMDPGLRPVDKHLRDKVVVGNHSADRQQFQPPTAVASEEEKQPETATAGILTPRATEKPESFWEKLRNLDKKQWAIIIGVLVLLIGGGIAAFLVLHKSPQPVAKKTTTTKSQNMVPPTQPTTVASTMSGLQVDPSVNERTVTGIMVENSELARPQSGIDQADVVFEAVAEGGITRFLLLFQDNAPGYVGPVRSVRPYYISWALGFDAAIAHVGGSPEGLQDMKKAKDLDQFTNGSFFHRISSRYAPHNVYTSIANMNQLEIQKNFGKSKYTPLLRRAETPSKTPNAKSIDLTISSSAFNVHYDYDPGTNTYKRSEGGAPHMVVDEQGNQTQLHPKVVVALTMDQGIAPDDLHTSYGTLGFGHAYVFQDGNVAEATWKKSSTSGNFTFTDSKGAPLGLNPGQTWFTAVNSNDHVSYKP